MTVTDKEPAGEPTDPQPTAVEPAEPQTTGDEPTEPQTTGDEPTEPQTESAEPAQPQTTADAPTEPQPVVAEPAQPQRAAAKPAQPQPTLSEPPKRRSRRDLLRKLMLAVPWLLLLAAIGAAMGFYATMQPVLVYVGIGLVVASILWLILLGFMAA